MDTRYIDCDVHGQKRKAYFVCQHVLKDRKLIASLVPWSNKAGGEVVCAKGEDHPLRELFVMCEDHLVDLGVLMPSELEVN